MPTKKMKKLDQEEIFYDFMDELQEEWANGREKYVSQRNADTGIRSSQIAALVGLLVKKGIIKRTD